MNRLSHEISPYLLQHAHNPVDWYPWGDAALAMAKKEDKPIFLSIGYATCHWCHVMEGDSFEKEDVAAILNQHFISIKVDREERPDVDGLYMKAVQAMNQRGGWPLSVMLTPEGKPFWGGTFFPREQFKDILQKIAQLWRERRPDIDDNAAELTSHLEHLMLRHEEASTFDASVLPEFIKQELQSYDPTWGGFGGAPKFPPAMALMTMMRYSYRQADAKVLEAVRGTLDGMARGGMRDQVGGGFHRYSVDETWLVPHFEKMLYDNALLTLAYTDAYQLVGEASYAEVVHTTLRYVLRDMQSPEGGFYSAEDADSEKTEGKFYVWTYKELKEKLTEEEFDFFQQYFSVFEEGNFVIDRRVEALEEAAGLKAVHAANILHHQKKTELPRADDHHYAALLDRLLRIRNERVRPGLDDKILCAWNGLMIAALSRAHRVFGHDEYLAAARRAADFALNKLSRQGQLLRSYRAGEARYAAYLEDYASLIFGLTELYQASFEARYLREAIALQTVQNEFFWDEGEGVYFETDGKDPTLILRSKDISDHAVPSGNSLSALNLLVLSSLTGDLKWERDAHRILNHSSSLMRRFPRALPFMLMALDFASSPTREMVIASDSPQAFRWPDLAPQYAPHTVFLKADPALADICPSVKDKVSREGETQYFVCVRGACQLPTTSRAEALSQLEGKI